MKDKSVEASFADEDDYSDVFMTVDDIFSIYSKWILDFKYFFNKEMFFIFDAVQGREIKLVMKLGVKWQGSEL